MIARVFPDVHIQRFVYKWLQQILAPKMFLEINEHNASEYLTGEEISYISIDNIISWD